MKFVLALAAIVCGSMAYAEESELAEVSKDEQEVTMQPLAEASEEEAAAEMLPILE